MANDLTQYILERTPGKFKALPHYSAAGDFLTFFWKNEDAYAHRVDDLVTVYLAFATKRPVGCKIKGFQRVVMNDAGCFFNYDEKIKLSYLILAGKALARKRGTDEEEMEDDDLLQEVAENTKDVDVDLEELECCTA